MRHPLTRRGFLQNGTLLVTSGLAAPALARTSALNLERTPTRQVVFGRVATGSAGAVGELRRFAPDPRADPIKGLEWWNDNYLRICYDLAMTDAAPEALSKVDPDDIVATCADAGFQTLWS
jgi:hypothetical protein